jgi:putative SOS response-associated peptidase YedK
MGTRGTKKEPVTGDHLLFAFLTTEPNAEVAPMHEKAMPVLLLDCESRETWMEGSVEGALALQGPAPDGTLKIVAAGLRKDARAA